MDDGFLDQWLAVINQTLVGSAVTSGILREMRASVKFLFVKYDRFNLYHENYAEEFSTLGQCTCDSIRSQSIRNSIRGQSRVFDGVSVLVRMLLEAEAI